MSLNMLQILSFGYNYLYIQVCLAVVLFAAVAMAAPFNAKPLPDAWFYNGDVARAPNFSIDEVT